MPQARIRWLRWVAVAAVVGLVGGVIAALLVARRGNDATKLRRAVAPSTGPANAGGRGSGEGLRVSGNRILNDSKVFIPTGFVVKGMMDAPEPGGCRVNDGANSPDSVLNAASWQKMRGTWKATAVRAHVSQSGLWGGGHNDKRGNRISDAMADAYAQHVEDTVRAITESGLVVVLSMQDQPASCGWSDALPSTVTKAAWDRLLSRDGANSIRRNPEVIINLFNEPVSQPTPAGWAQWAHGGSGPVVVNGCAGRGECNHGHSVVGHQDLVRFIRSKGVTNVILADAANKAGKLNGLFPTYRLTDSSPGRGIAYDIHPFYFIDGPTGWDRRFGFAVDSKGPDVPVVAGAWNYFASECGKAPAAMARQFLTYLSAKNIGVFAFAWDNRIGASVVKTWQGDPNGGQCPAPHSAQPLPGSAFADYVRTVSSHSG